MHHFQWQVKDTFKDRITGGSCNFCHEEFTHDLRKELVGEISSKRVPINKVLPATAERSLLGDKKTHR